MYFTLKKFSISISLACSITQSRQLKSQNWKDEVINEALPGAWVGVKGPIYFRELGSTSSYFQVAGEQAL